MTGLCKIVAQISTDAERICEDIKNGNDRKCKEILNSAKAQAKLIAKNGEAEAKSLSSDILSRAHSAALLEKRSIILGAKQQIIKEALNNCRYYLCDLSDEKYFDLVINMVLKYSEKAKGEICFSEKDLARLPTNFGKCVNSVSQGELTISSVPADIDGGFLLMYGGVEVNCSFSAIFASKAEAFSDEVSSILFAQEEQV